MQKPVPLMRGLDWNGNGWRKRGKLCGDRLNFLEHALAQIVVFVLYSW